MKYANSLESRNNGHGTTQVVEPAAYAGPPALHPAWQTFLQFCRQLGHGEIERLKIQDGLPVLAEVTTRKVKFTS
jgi:hypothetical protein